MVEARGQACRNCGLPIAGRFCSGCGQGVHEESRSLGEFGRELLEHHLFLDGRGGRSILALLTSPGLLSRAFAEGRRASFLPPLRLYLFASLIFFGLLWVSGLLFFQVALHQVQPGEAVLGVWKPDRPDLYALVFRLLAPPSASELPPDLDAQVQAVVSQPGQARLIEAAKRVLADPTLLNPVTEEWLPRLIVALLPLVAACLALATRRQGLYFVDHLIFALHGQAFAFLVMSVLILARLADPAIGVPVWLLALLLGAYYTLAMRRMYPAGWGVSILRTLFVGGVYTLSLVIGLLAVLAYGVDTVAKGG